MYENFSAARLLYYRNVGCDCHHFVALFLILGVLMHFRKEFAITETKATLRDIVTAVRSYETIHKKLPKTLVELFGSQEQTPAMPGDNCSFTRRQREIITLICIRLAPMDQKHTRRCAI